MFPKTVVLFAAIVTSPFSVQDSSIWAVTAPQFSIQRTNTILADKQGVTEDSIEGQVEVRGFRRDCPEVASCLEQLVKPEAEDLVQQLRNLPTPLPSSVPSDGRTQPEEELRRRLYESLRRLGPSSVLALGKALSDDDVHFRKNAALALGVLGGDWYQLSGPKLDTRLALPAMVAALRDSDSDVRAWSAQAIGEVGPDATEAVPSLITLLSNSDEGSRNSACIALRGIGPPAKAALPMLRLALSDPSKDVRGFAALAVESIER